MKLSAGPAENVTPREQTERNFPRRCALNMHVALCRGVYVLVLVLVLLLLLLLLTAAASRSAIAAAVAAALASRAASRAARTSACLCICASRIRSIVPSANRNMRLCGRDWT